MIFDENTIIDYLSKRKNKELKLTRQDFVIEFNKEAKKQNNEWRARVENCKGLTGESFQLLYISKKEGWIFKNTISLHIGNYENNFSFVNNDYSLGEYSKKQNEKIFKIFPEFKSVLEKIPIAFSILKDYSESAMNNRIGSITKEIEKLKQVSN